MQVKLEKKGKQEILVITLPVDKKPSKSGKSMLIATTNGNIPSKVEVDGQTLVVSVNAYIKK